MKDFSVLYPITYYPIYKKITGSVTAGLLLSLLVEHFRVKNKICLTDNEIMKKILLNEKELRNAKSKIKKLPFIEVTREGIPAKTYYRMDWEKYDKEIEGII